MKKLLFLFTLATFLFSCSSEELEVQNADQNANLTYTDNSNYGIYKGVFTTNDGFERATVVINVVKNGPSVATLNFPNGKNVVYTANSDNSTSVDTLVFTSKESSFNASFSNNGKDAVISDVIFDNRAGDIIIIKETSRAPLTTFSGTYLCPTCSNGTAKTFNIIASGDGTGNQSLTTQMVYNSVPYAGIGVQNNCTVAGPISVCAAFSGDGVSTTVGFSVGGSDVEWAGEMIYSNGSPDCSEISGAWFFRRGLAGEKSGTFRSDAVTNCLTELVFEDFEDATVTYTTSIPEFSDGFYDYFTRTDGSNIGSNVNLSDTIGAGFFGAQDVDGEGATAPLYLNFLDLNVNSMDTIFFGATFAEDDDGTNQDWDDSDNVIAEFSFDGVVWIPFFAIEGDGSSGTAFNSIPRVDTDFDGVGDGDEITDSFTPYAAGFPNNGITNPLGSPTVNIRIAINLNSGDEDIAIDNILIRGL